MKKAYQMTGEEWNAYLEKGKALTEKYGFYVRKLRNRIDIHTDNPKLENRLDTAKRRYLSLKNQFLPRQPRQNLYDL